MESGTTTPLPPPRPKWPGVRVDFLHVKKKLQKPVSTLLIPGVMRNSSGVAGWVLWGGPGGGVTG